MACCFGGRVRELGLWDFSQWGRWGKPTSQTFSNLFLKTLSGAYSSISQPSPKMPTLAFGGASHLGASCRGDLLGRVEWAGEKNVWINIQKAARNEGPAAAAFLRREVTHARYQLRLVEQAGIPYSRCGRTKFSYNGMDADFERPWRERFIMRINRLALFAASVHWAEAEKTFFAYNVRLITHVCLEIFPPNHWSTVLLPEFNLDE